jgi:hypothetical protein
MGFFGSICAWMILIFIIAAIVFLVFMFILGWIYPQELKELTTSPADAPIIQEESIDQRQRKWIGIFVLIVLVLIMTGTGISALMNEISKP